MSQSTEHGGASGDGPSGRGLGFDAPYAIFDSSDVDTGAVAADRKLISEWNPHRGHMALLDSVVWHSEDYVHAVGLRAVRSGEFWEAGHFPGRPMFPGVLMVETAAQLCCYQYLRWRGEPGTAAFTRIADTSFRSGVVPGDDLYILAKATKRSRRLFVCECQGVVNGKLAFETQISGLLLVD